MEFCSVSGKSLSFSTNLWEVTSEPWFPCELVACVPTKRTARGKSRKGNSFGGPPGSSVLLGPMPQWLRTLRALLYTAA